MTSPRRVLLIVNNFPSPNRPQDGIFILRQIEALEELGWEVRVVRFVPWAPPFGSKWKGYRKIPGSYAYNGISVRTVRVLLLPGMGLMEYIGLQAASVVRSEVKEFSPQLIHAHQLIPTGLIAVGHGLPCIVTAHGSDAYRYPYRNVAARRAAEKVVACADKIVAVSAFVAQHVERFGRVRIDVIFNGADHEVFFPRDREESRSKLSIDAMQRVVLFAGYLEESKGVYDLVEALCRLQQLEPMLLLAGDGAERTRLGRRLEEARIKHRFLGVLDHSQLALAMGAANVVVLPSHREGLPAVVCEAMLAGRVVVATRVGGIPEVLIDRYTGFLTPAADKEALAAAIGEAFENTPLAANIEASARQFALANLTWRENALKYSDLYSQLAERSANLARS